MVLLGDANADLSSIKVQSFVSQPGRKRAWRIFKFAVLLVRCSVSPVKTGIYVKGSKVLLPDGFPPPWE
jgi:hypothetical protein